MGSGSVPSARKGALVAHGPLDRNRQCFPSNALAPAALSGKCSHRLKRSATRTHSTSCCSCSCAWSTRSWRLPSRRGRCSRRLRCSSLPAPGRHRACPRAPPAGRPRLQARWTTTSRGGSSWPRSSSASMRWQGGMASWRGSVPKRSSRLQRRCAGRARSPREAGRATSRTPKRCCRRACRCRRSCWRASTARLRRTRCAGWRRRTRTRRRAQPARPHAPQRL